MVDDFFNKNYNKIVSMSINTARKNKNNSYSEDLIQEFYLFLIERMNRNKIEDDLKKAMYYFFGCQYFKGSVLRKLSDTDKLDIFYIDSAEIVSNILLNELTSDNDGYNNLISSVELDNEIEILEQKLKRLSQPYQEFFNLYFIQKKSLKEISKLLNTNYRGVKQIRDELYKKLK